MSKPSSIDISNVALSHLGHTEIRDFTEKNGIRCKRFYDFDLRWLLSRFDWSFARKQTSLQVLTTPVSTTTFVYAYAIPSDCLVPRILLPGGSKIKWQVYGNEIHTDLANACLVYTQVVTDTGRFTSMFADLLAYRIAIKLAQSLASDKMMRNVLKQEYDREYELAILEDAEIGSDYLYADRDPNNDPWINNSTVVPTSDGGY